MECVFVPIPLFLPPLSLLFFSGHTHSPCHWPRVPHRPPFMPRTTQTHQVIRAKGLCRDAGPDSLRSLDSPSCLTLPTLATSSAEPRASTANQPALRTSRHSCSSHGLSHGSKQHPTRIARSQHVNWSNVMSCMCPCPPPPQQPHAPPLARTTLASPNWAKYWLTCSQVLLLSSPLNLTKSGNQKLQGDGAQSKRE